MKRPSFALVLVNVAALIFWGDMALVFWGPMEDWVGLCFIGLFFLGWLTALAGFYLAIVRKASWGVWLGIGSLVLFTYFLAGKTERQASEQSDGGQSDSPQHRNLIRREIVYNQNLSQGIDVDVEVVTVYG